MKTHRLPLGLKLAILSLLLCLPFMATQVILFSVRPWWDPPWSLIRFWGLLLAVFLFPFMFFLYRGKQWVLWVFSGLSIVWFTASFFAAVRLGGGWPGFFVLFLGAFLGIMAVWLHRELHRSYFDAGGQWFQELPWSIAGIRCELGGLSGVELSVARLDREGAFVFDPKMNTEGAFDLFSSKKLDQKQLCFIFKEKRVVCEADLIRTLKGGVGAGFRFKRLRGDQRKELGDLIEGLQGAGYV